MGTDDQPVATPLDEIDSLVERLTAGDVDLSHVATTKALVVGCAS